jgi:hypothetical protein
MGPTPAVPLTAGYFRSRPFSEAALSAKQVQREESIGATIGSLLASALELRMLFALGLFGDASSLPVWNSAGWIWAAAAHVLLVRRGLPHSAQAAPTFLPLRSLRSESGTLF